MLTKNQTLFAVFLLCIITRLLSSIFYIEDIDSLRFALSIYEYDITKLQPHFPGYPIFSFFVKIIYFLTGSLDATYKIASDQATESYNAMGIDAALVVHQDAAFFKAGMHSSELNGDASITIGSTTYAVSETISGTGFLVGGGLEIDDSRYGLTYYSDMGGDADSDMLFLYGGVVF